MHIVNVMFARGLGGIEQSFLDYCIALEMQGNQVTAMVHPKAAVRGRFSCGIAAIHNHGQWDPIAKFRIRRRLKKIKPDAVIVHGNRAATLLTSAARGICPVIGVTHNYSVKRLAKLDGVFALTEDLQKKMLEVGFPKNRIFKVPNMIACPNPVPLTLHQPPVIATLGRFVKKKGFDVWIKALAELQKTGQDFRAIIGGKGEEEVDLKQLVKEHNLSDKVEFKGWVQDKESFFRAADVFCLPSRHEPFGIVLLEAMAYGIPTVSTDSEGPSEVATHGQDALLVPKNDPVAMAAAIQRLITDRELAQKLAASGLETVHTKYDIKAVSQTIQTALQQVTHA